MQDERPKYQCPQCGSVKFVTQPNQFDIYIAEGNDLQFSHSELIDDQATLKCKDCGTAIAYQPNDLKM